MSRKVLSCTQPAGQANDFELIQTESQHSTGVPTCHHFPRFVVISEKSRPEVGNRWRWSSFLDKRPLNSKFSKKMFFEIIHHVIEPRLVCNFRDIWLTGNRQSRALFTWQKKQNIRKLSLLSGSHPKSPNNMLAVLQISSKSVHFRRCYSRTLEHRWNAPQSISNTRRSLSNYLNIGQHFEYCLTA